MEGILSWGLSVVRVVQTMASPTLTFFMRVLSWLGTEWFYLAALSLVYWCVDRVRGARIGLVFLGSVFLNGWIKDLFLQPRPYELDPALGLSRETSPGFPSGHAQNAVCFWGLAAPLFKRPIGLILAVVFPLFIGFSRIYLGVHFPTDVFGGWLIGMLVLLGDAVFGDRLVRFLERVNIRIKVAALAALAFGMNALDMRDTSIAGVFFGAGVGFVFAGRVAPFSASGTFGKRLARYALGLSGALIVYLGLKFLLPGPESELYNLLRFLRYGLLGAWVALGAPWLFLRLGLAEREKSEATR